MTEMTPAERLAAHCPKCGHKVRLYPDEERGFRLAMEQGEARMHLHMGAVLSKRCDTCHGCGRLAGGPCPDCELGRRLADADPEDEWVARNAGFWLSAPAPIITWEPVS